MESAWSVCLATPCAAQWIASKMPSHQVHCGQTRLPALASSSPISPGSVSLSVLLIECAATVEFDIQVGMPIQLSSKQFLQPTPRIGPLSTSQWLLICCCCIPCRSRKAPGSSALRCQCSRCPLEQQPARPVHGRLANVSCCCMDPSDKHTVSAKTTQTRPSDCCAVVVDGQWSMPGQTASQRTCLPVCSLPSVRPPSVPPPCWARLSDGHDHASLGRPARRPAACHHEQ
ncbi:hypothetical protein BC831DRAFT_107954 [Entophlyctis helioformis]|nr:hypothetical protein BC831DRAFT_107954 [Entophlyctis helioformis]